MSDTSEKSTMQKLSPEEINAVMGGANINDIAAKAADKPEDKPAEVIPPAPSNDNEPPADTPPVDTPPADGNEPPAAEPQGFNIEFFNKQFSTDYKDEDDIKEALEARKKNEDLQKQVDTIQSLQEELDILRQETDPMKYFASEDDFRVAQFKKDFPDKDPAMVARLFSTDLSQASDFDVLTWMTMLDNPNLEGGEAGARELVADTYGVDDPSDLQGMDSLTKNKLRVSASKERGRLGEMKSGIQLPEKKDYSTVMEARKAEEAAKLTELTEGWNKVSEAVLKNFPDIVINDKDKDGNETEFFRYEVGSDLDKETIQPLLEGFIKLGVPLDDKAAQALGTAIQKDYVYRNVDKLIKKAVKNAVATEKEKALEEEHNPGSPNTGERPKGGGSDQTARIMANLKGGSLAAKRA